MLHQSNSRYEVYRYILRTQQISPCANSAYILSFISFSIKESSSAILIIPIKMDIDCRIWRIRLGRHPVARLIIIPLHSGQELAILGAEAQRVRERLILEELVADQFVVAETGVFRLAPLA